MTARCALATVLLLSLGCRGERGEGAAPPAAAGGIPTDLGPGGFDLADPRAGSARLAGHESALTVSFDGTRGGSPYRWSSRYRYHELKSPAARLLDVGGSPSTAERDGVRYRWSPGGQCTAAVIEPADSVLPPLDPAASLPGVLGAEPAGTAQVHGVQAARYTFDQRALGLGGTGSAKGELAVASEGGHLLRYRLEIAADSAYFGGGAEGTLTWDYEMTPSARPAPISLPAGCAPGVPDAPRLADATEVERHPGVLRYRTAGTVADAVAFYARELDAQGWKQPAAAGRGAGAGAASGMMAAMLDEAMAADPELRKAMEDPETRKAMERAGVRLPGVNAPAVEPPAPGETHLLFERGGRKLRVLVTPGEPGSEVLVLGDARE